MHLPTKHVFIILFLMMLIVGTVSATTYTSQYPPGYNDTYVKAMSKFSSFYWPHFSTNPALSLTGGYFNNQWRSNTASTGRFHIDLGSGKIIKRIYYENSHDTGANTNTGIRNFTFWGSDSAESFADLTYANDTGWTQLTTDVSSLDQHSALDAADPKYVLVTNTDDYRYYAIKISSGWGGSTLAIRRVELQTEDAAGDPPVASFTAGKQVILFGNTVTFTDTSTESPDEWSWDMGDGRAVVTTQSPTYQYWQRGMFKVILTATNGAGSDASDPTYVWVRRGHTQSFTPSNPLFVNVDDGTYTSNRNLSEKEELKVMCQMKGYGSDCYAM